MAEIGLAASLLSIAGFGIQLTNTLYNFGSTASSARDQTDRVARHVTLYSDVLELLAGRINEDEPVHSEKALNLVDEICEQSQDLFDQIRCQLPSRSQKLSFVQKIKWNLRKSRVDLLVTEIEYLKSTVNLLVSVLYAGKKIRSYRRTKKSKGAKQEADVHYARAQNAVVEQINATALKEDMQARVDNEESDENEQDDSGGRRSSLALIKHAPPLPHLTHNYAIVRFNGAMAKASNSSEERSLVLQNSSNLVQDLLEEWTTLAADDAETEAHTDHIRLSEGDKSDGVEAGSTTHHRAGASVSQIPPAAVDASGKIRLLEEQNQRFSNTIEQLSKELARVQAQQSTEQANTSRDEGQSSGRGLEEISLSTRSGSNYGHIPDYYPPTECDSSSEGLAERGAPRIPREGFYWVSDEKLARLRRQRLANEGKEDQERMGVFGKVAQLLFDERLEDLVDPREPAAARAKVVANANPIEHLGYLDHRRLSPPRSSRRNYNVVVSGGKHYYPYNEPQSITPPRYR
jgi:hypothetical protein